MRIAPTVVALAALAASCTKPAPPTTVGARHVILVSFDTTRPDHFGFMGNASVATPRMDALALESLVFTDYMTAAATTLASHTSLFTGNYPHRHGVPRNGFMVNDENETLAETLKRNGFRTAAFIASFALESRFHIDQGFDVYDENFSVLVGDGGADQNQRRAGEVTDAVVGYLDQNETPDRLFLFVHYFDPHAPYAAPAPFDSLYDPQGTEGMPSMYELVNATNFTQEEMRDIARRQMLQYASETTYMDHEFGRLLDELRQRGILDDALLVVTSDHGENLVDHPDIFDHGRTLYQSTVHGVCVIRLPGADATSGVRSDIAISGIDVKPTILGALGIAAGNTDGVAVDLGDPARADEDHLRFAEASKPWRQVEVPGEWTNAHKSRCARRGNYKYIVTPYTGVEELYDLSRDPGETRNLLVIAPQGVEDIADQLRNELATWSADADPLPSEFEREQFEDTMKKLKSLGYIR